MISSQVKQSQQEVNQHPIEYKCVRTLTYLDYKAEHS